MKKIKQSEIKKGYLDDRWKALRIKVFKRDNFKCLKCGSNYDLRCHHKYYKPNTQCWDYPLKAFETLCHECHDGFHKVTPGKNLVKRVKVKKTKSKSKLVTIYNSLSRKDKELQFRRDTIFKS